MIHIENSEMHFKGSSTTLKTELVVIMKGLIEELGISKEEMLKYVDSAYLSDDELKKQALKILEKKINILGDFLDTLKKAENGEISKDDIGDIDDIFKKLFED